MRYEILGDYAPPRQGAVKCEQTESYIEALETAKAFWVSGVFREVRVWDDKAGRIIMVRGFHNNFG